MASDSSLKIAFSLSGDRKDIYSVVEKVFWKEKDVVPNAVALLTYIRDWSNTSSPHLAQDWMKYCRKTGITQSQYHTILKRLRLAGMIEKKYNKELGAHTITISALYPENLRQTAETYEKFIRNI